MKILLVSANTLTAPYPVYPIGLDYVAGALGEAHTVEILDLNTAAPAGTIASALDRFAPDLIGISLRNIDNTDIVDVQSYLAGYRDLIREIRARSAAPVVLGGSGFTIFPRRILKAVGADYGIVGEGERLAHLVDALEQGTDPAAVAGVVQAGSESGKGATLPPPLERPLRRAFRAGRAHTDFYLKHGAMLNRLSKRGCPFRCSYCT